MTETVKTCTMWGYGAETLHRAWDSGTCPVAEADDEETICPGLDFLWEQTNNSYELLTKACPMGLGLVTI